MKNYPAKTIYDFIVQDFRSSWDSLARTPGPLGRGNFAFGRQAMAVLEFAGRLAKSDPTGVAEVDLAAAIRSIEPKYFTHLPGACGNIDAEIAFPGPAPAEEYLLGTIFDLVRNGAAHQYQQVVAQLTDGSAFGISMSGPVAGRTLASVRVGDRANHLAVDIDPSGTGEAVVVVRPEVLFLDLDDAVSTSGLLHRGLAFNYLARPRTRTPRVQRQPASPFAYSHADVRAALYAGGHPAYKRPPSEPTIEGLVRRTLARGALGVLRKLVP